MRQQITYFFTELKYKGALQDGTLTERKDKVKNYCRNDINCPYFTLME